MLGRGSLVAPVGGLLGLAAATIMMGLPAPVSAAPLTQVPSCLAGNWRVVDWVAFALSRRAAEEVDATAQLAQLQGTLLAGIPEATLAVLRDPGYRHERVSGDVLLSIQPSGAYEERYSQLTMRQEAPGVGASTIVQDFVANGTFFEPQPGFIGNRDVLMVGSTTSTPDGGEPYTFPMEGAEPGPPEPYECAGNRLTFFTVMSDGRRVPEFYVRQ